MKEERDKYIPIGDIQRQQRQDREAMQQQERRDRFNAAKSQLGSSLRSGFHQGVSLLGRGAVNLRNNYASGRRVAKPIPAPMQRHPSRRHPLRREYYPRDNYYGPQRRGYYVPPRRVASRKKRSAPPVKKGIRRDVNPFFF